MKEHDMKSVAELRTNDDDDDDDDDQSINQSIKYISGIIQIYRLCFDHNC